MRTKEFIKRVEELGFQVWAKLDSKNNYILLNVGDGEDTFAVIWTQYRYALSTMEYGFTHFKDYLPLQKLYKLCFEYASTPVSEREEEEKDKKTLPNWRTRCFGEAVKDSERENDHETGKLEE